MGEPRLIAEDGPEVEAMIAKRLKEQAEALKLAGLDKQVATFNRQFRKVSLRLDRMDERLEENNHLRRDLATKEYIDQKLAGVVIVQELGDGDYTVRFGDVVLDPADVDELPLVTKAHRAAREAAASAKDAAKSATEASTLRSLWVTAAAGAASAVVATSVAVGGLLWFLHLRGVI